MVLTRILGWTAVVLTLVLIGALGHKAWPLLFPRPQAQVPWDPDCDLRAGPCESALPGGGRVSLEISPSNIPTVQPLQLHVGLQGPAPKVSRVLVDFSGVDMNMGFNRVALQEKAAGTYTGQGTLSVCVRAAMEWQASVLIHTGQGTISVPYRFVVVKPDAR